MGGAGGTWEWAGCTWEGVGCTWEGTMVYMGRDYGVHGKGLWCTWGLW